MASDRDIVLGDVATDLLSKPLEFAVLLPPDGPIDGVPLLYFLHGGGGSRDFLATSRAMIERAWSEGVLPPVVVVTPSVERSFYMNYRDGSERWEDAVIGPLHAAMIERFGASADPRAAAAVGVSMGGMGGLRLAFKYPDRFTAVAALEPGIEPSLSFGAVETRDRFWRDDELFERIYGSPVDEEYWQANNPGNIAVADAARLRSSGLHIALECGDEDSFGLHRGAEFLHRILWDNEIRHDYRLVLGADHLGRTLPARFHAALAFVGAALRPPPPDDSLAQLHRMIANLKTRAGLPA